MNGARRVIIFCLLTAVLPIILLVMPLYLRHSLYADVVYAVTESDIMEITDGVSTIFCSAHTLEMNSSFNAFQMSHRPEITSYRKHIRLKKSMILPDDTFEYWGFYLLRGANVILSVCSRFQGASILVVKGDRTLQTCGMLEHNVNKARRTGIYLPEAQNQVKITYESNAQLITSAESNVNNTAEKINTRGKSEMEKSMRDLTGRLRATARTEKSKQIDNQSSNIRRKMRHVKQRFHADEEKFPLFNREDDIYEGKSSRRKRSYNKRFHRNNDDKSKNILKKLMDDLNDPGIDNGAEENDNGIKIDQSHNFKRIKRNQEPVKPPSLLDRGIKHGGNAFRDDSDDYPVSSFEEGLIDCWQGTILTTKKFNASDLCTDVNYLSSGEHMQLNHTVTMNGYYYYVFYSDNDIVTNDIHAIFDIHKPTFQYENVTKSCLNDTKCTFPLSMLSNDRVIVEVPTRDGIEHESDDISILVSVCHPRMGMYIIFPIAVLFLILSCAFL